MLELRFDRHRLSDRESAVLSFAIEGQTDIQIARSLDIRPSTVNSYWVRIRGKLGQLSRTELVALALKQQMTSERDDAQDKLDVLRGEAKDHAEITSDFTNAEVYHTALSILPEALLVCNSRAEIWYSNSRLEKMFGYEPTTLLGLTIDELLPAPYGSREHSFASEILSNSYPTRIGMDRVVYGQRKDGSQFRLILVIDSGMTSTGQVFSVLIRDFGIELDTRRRLSGGWEVY